MKILSSVTMAGNVDMSSTNKDTFTIGTPLENNDGQVDILNIYANADFKNNVILGSSSVDVVTSNAQITASGGILLQDSSLYLTGANASIFVNGQDLLGGGGGEGSPSITDVQSTGSGVSIVSANIDNIIYLKSLSGDQDRINIQDNELGDTIEISLSPQNYDYSVLTPSTGTLGSGETSQSEAFYLKNNDTQNVTHSLPDAQTFVKRFIIIKNISTQYDILLSASGSQEIDGSGSLTLPVNTSYTLHSIDEGGYKWVIISKYP